MNLVGIDFEMANATKGALCAFGIHYPNGDNSYAALRLHPEHGGVQERTAYHGIHPILATDGMPPETLYNRLLALPEDTVLAAHDARIDRRELAAWYDMWGLEPLYFTWIDTLKIAQRHYTKGAKNGVAARAERMGLKVRPHNPTDDAWVAWEIAARYDWGNLQPIRDSA